jgi:hypothetical protein
MRNHQLSVRISKVPKKNETFSADNFQELKRKKESKLLGVYADANNFYEAYCAAYNETILEVLRCEETGKLSGKEKEDFSGKMEVEVLIHFSKLLNPQLGSTIVFSEISDNVYEALAKAFNKVLHEVQKHVKLPEFGRKEHRS